MAYELTIIEKPSYLHFVVRGENTKENVSAYLEEILRECRSRGCYKVLIEERLGGTRLGTADVFALASEGSARAVGAMRAIAYVDVNGQGGLMQFAENVAVNRALPVTVFSTVAEAEEWLRSQGA
jgi:hypothetical protein